MLVWWIASLSAVRYGTRSSFGTCAELDVPSFIMIDECITFNDTTGRIVLSSSETMEVSEEGGVMKLQPRNHNNSVQTRFYYVKNETESHFSRRPENAYLVTYSYDPDEIQWEEILGVNVTVYCTLVKEWLEGGPCTTDPNEFPVWADTHSYLDTNNWFPLVFKFNPQPEPVFNQLTFGSELINEEDGTLDPDPSVYCYALKSNGKCDGDKQSPPNSFSYRNWGESSAEGRGYFLYPTNLSFVNVLTFDHPVQHEQLELKQGGCIHSMNISLQDGAYMFHYSGPTHYTDMNMDPVTKTGKWFDWKNYSICMETETRVVVKFEFQDDLHLPTRKTFAYDPVVSFQALSPPSPSTPLPSLPPPSPSTPLPSLPPPSPSTPLPFAPPSPPPLQYVVKANVTIAADYNTFDTEPFRKTFASLANVSLAAVTVTKYPGSVILVTETALPTKDAKDTVVQILTNATTLSDALKDAPVPFDASVESISALSVVEVEVPDVADTQSNTPLPSLPPPSSPSPPSASLWFVPMLIIFLLACICITVSASLQRLSRTF